MADNSCSSCSSQQQYDDGGLMIASQFTRNFTMPKQFPLVVVYTISLLKSPKMDAIIIAWLVIPSCSSIAKPAQPSARKTSTLVLSIGKESFKSGAQMFDFGTLI